MKKLLNPIIDKINKLSNTNNIIHDFDNIVLENYDKTKKYTIDFFIYDVKKYVKTRLISIIVYENNICTLIGINLSNSNYINEMNVNKMDSKTIDSLGKFKQIPTNTSLEQSLITYSKCNPDGKQSDDENSWIQPIKAEILEQSNKKVFPSRKVSDGWTTQGIQYTDPCLNDSGINSSDIGRRVTATFNPTIPALPRDNLGLRGGIFNSAGIMPSFPSTGSRGGTGVNWSRG